MNVITLLTIIYIVGVIIGALFFDVWGPETTFTKTMSIFLLWFGRNIGVKSSGHHVYQMIEMWWNQVSLYVHYFIESWFSYSSFGKKVQEDWTETHVKCTQR